MKAPSKAPLTTRLAFSSPQQNGSSLVQTTLSQSYQKEILKHRLWAYRILQRKQHLGVQGSISFTCLLRRVMDLLCYSDL